jgi:hypothetical protein
VGEWKGRRAGNPIDSASRYSVSAWSQSWGDTPAPGGRDGWGEGGQSIEDESAAASGSRTTASHNNPKFLLSIAPCDGSRAQRRLGGGTTECATLRLSVLSDFLVLQPCHHGVGLLPI